MLGLATFRRDGFVSLDAGEEAGEMLTKPLVFDGELHLNLNATRGYLIAELCDDQGKLIEGYTSSPVTGNHLDLPVTFDQPIEALADNEGYIGRLRLRFRLRQASLYSYWFI